jgi:hypothetical protein
MVSAVEAQQKPVQTAKWKSPETDSESQFTGRYANCDYGFYVLLRKGYLAHGNHSPNPNHGFLIALPDTGITDFVSTDDKRFIWVNAEYNAYDMTSLKEVTDWQVKISGDGKTNFKVLSRGDTKLNGLPAKRVGYEYDGSNGRVIEEQVIAIRAGIFYEIGLRTVADDYKSDEVQFLKILDNFRWWRIHYC